MESNIQQTPFYIKTETDDDRCSMSVKVEARNSNNAEPYAGTGEVYSNMPHSGNLCFDEVKQAHSERIFERGSIDNCPVLKQENCDADVLDGVCSNEVHMAVADKPDFKFKCDTKNENTFSSNLYVPNDELCVDNKPRPVADECMHEDETGLSSDIDNKSGDSSSVEDESDNMMPDTTEPVISVESSHSVGILGNQQMTTGTDLRPSNINNVNAHAEIKSSKCHLCKIDFPTFELLKTHMNRHTADEPFLCNICDMSFVRQIDLKKHTRKAHKAVKVHSCPVCNSGFTLASGLKRHMATHIVETNPDSCPICKISFPRHDNFLKHMRLHTGEKPFTCDVCKSSFSTSVSLDRHMIVHAEEKPYSCSTCNAGFTQLSALRTHMEIHDGDKSFPCRTCNMQFSDEAELGQHTLTHMRDNPFTCGICGERFSQSNLLKKHMPKHGRNGMFSCPTCNKIFTQRCTLKKHVMLHTGEKPFSCPDCGKRFAAYGNLTQHVRIHTGEKPYVCATCSQRFSGSGTLKKHMLTHKN